MKLTYEELDDIDNAISSMKTIHKVLDMIASNMERNHIRQDAGNISERDLLLSKARAEGARRLTKMFEKEIENLRKGKKSA